VRQIELLTLKFCRHWVPEGFESAASSRAAQYHRITAAL